MRGLQYGDIPNVNIFDAVYGSWILPVPLFTLGDTINILGI